MNFIPAHSPRTRKLRRGFTLIELLTVIAIIGVLAAIIIPTVGKVRTTAKRAQGLSNLRQIMLASISFMEDNKGNWLKTDGGGQDFYPLVITRYVAKQSGSGNTTQAEVFSDPMLPKTGQLHFACVHAFFTDVYGSTSSIVKARNIRNMKAPAKTVLFADNYNDKNITEGYAGAWSSIQNTGVSIWGWPGVWGTSYTPSESDGKQLPPADYGRSGGQIDLLRDPGQAKLGFLDGHVAVVKREQMFHRLFDPRFE